MRAFFFKLAYDYMWNYKLQDWWFCSLLLSSQGLEYVVDTQKTESGKITVTFYNANKVQVKKIP